MPIACFLSHAGDSIKEQIDTSSELAYLSVMGGGTAVHSAIRAVSDKAPGPIPYIKTIDGLMGYYRQGKTRRGSTAVYLDISHPDVIEFIGMRKPSGGDPARKINNRAGVHNAVNITDEFRIAVNNDAAWPLICPHTKEVKEVVKARWLWEELLATRGLTGEPYLYLIDEANRHLPQAQKGKGLRNNGSNLCSEITLATSASRTAVCCLSSVNLEKWDEWKDSGLISKLVRFLDNVIQWFIDYAPDELSRAVTSAKAERAIGIGAMGWHNLLMSKMIPFESGGFGSASQLNHIIFSRMHSEALEATQQLATERGEPSDLTGTGRRNSHLFAIAPNANSSVLCNTSPSIEPILSNAYTQKSRAGIHLVKNKYLEKWLYLRETQMQEGNPFYQFQYDEFWKDVIAHNGSVQHIEWIPEDVKKVFKTAWEIDQHWVVQHAGDRQQYICQAQSLNVFFLPGSDRAYINSVHLKWLRDGKAKSMYYFRTGAAQAADTVKEIQRQSLKDWSQDNEECVACQG
ncbi:MAG: ribonucleotide-diphosphate reductase subunit [Podoviridae sp. ctbj_2]|nr:MAG: ribonucleotide-diphosphate reductase subunit [Podoviridae sp. ctbj_2]